MAKNTVSASQVNYVRGDGEQVALPSVAVEGALTAANNLSDVPSPSTGLANLGGVGSVTAADTSIVVGGTAGAPTIATGTLDVIATQHAPAAPVPMNSQKLTGMANGSAATDSAAFGQIPVADSTAAHILPAAQSAAAGANGKWADSGHAHPPGSSFLVTPSSYAPSAVVQLSVATTTFADFNVTATTVAVGSNGGEISQVASWSSPSAGVLDVATTTGWPVAGTVNVAASGSTTAVVTYTGIAAGQLTGCAYVSGSATGTVATGGAVTLTSVATPSTGSFTATSTAVLVTVSFVSQSTSGDFCGLALAAHGTVTPLVSNVVEFQDSGSADPRPYCVQFLVTGLVAGNTYNFDLLGCCTAGAGNFQLLAYGQTGTTPATTRGAPVLMSVQAV